MSHMLQEVQDIIDYDFLNQKLESPVKLDILYYELDRLEKTLEMKGTPYVFLDPEEAEISIQDGKKKFKEHTEWIREKLADTEQTLPQKKESDTMDDLFNSLIDILWRDDVHAMVILTLAQIVIVRGLEEFCEPNN